MFTVFFLQFISTKQLKRYNTIKKSQILTILILSEMNKHKLNTHSLQVRLKFIPGVSCLTNSGVECVVDRVELVPHVICACSQTAVDLSS